MNTTLALHRPQQSSALVRPEPRLPGGVSIRPATANDLAFIDALQKKHSKMVGWLSKPILEKGIEQGTMLIAEEVPSAEFRVPGTESPTGNSALGTRNPLPTPPTPPTPPTGERIGYIFYRDRYNKREDVGIVYQLNVAPGKHRGLVGAALVQAAMDRCPRGVKLFCCYCAQDIEANHFWEAIGFVPLGFRTGSRSIQNGGRRKSDRIHIFWQKRIHAGDTGPGATPYWMPSETSGGAVKENRIVLPLLPDRHWSDEMPVVLPGYAPPPTDGATAGGPAQLEAKPKRPPTKKVKPAPVGGPVAPATSFGKCGLRFGPAPTAAPIKEPKAKREKQKNDPKLVAFARQMRDAFIDEVNGGRMLPSGTEAKYDVSRQLGACTSSSISTHEAGRPIGLLEAA